MNLKEMGCEDAGWIHLAQKRVQRRTVMNPWIFKNRRIS